MRDFEFKIAHKVVGLKYRDGGKKSKEIEKFSRNPKWQISPFKCCLKTYSEQKMGGGGQIWLNCITGELIIMIKYRNINSEGQEFLSGRPSGILNGSHVLLLSIKHHLPLKISPYNDRSCHPSQAQGGEQSWAPRKAQSILLPRCEGWWPALENWAMKGSQTS